jgi:hypothetical protein
MRIRTIKPEFWLHEGLCSCSEFTRLLAIALLNWSDDEGYFMAHPSLIRGSLFPFLDNSKNIPGSLQDLSRVGWIELGEDSQGRPVGRVTNFLKHQRVDKPQGSKIKGSSVFQEHSKNIPGIILEPSKEEWNGMEGEEEHGKGSGTEDEKPKNKRLPKPSVMTDEEWMASLKANPQYSGISIDSEFRRAAEWIAKNPDRKMSRPFFTNWLSKCEKPLTIKPKPVQTSCLGAMSFPKGHSYL